MNQIYVNPDDIEIECNSYALYLEGKSSAEVTTVDAYVEVVQDETTKADKEAFNTTPNRETRSKLLYAGMVKRDIRYLKKGRQFLLRKGIRNKIHTTNKRGINTVVGQLIEGGLAACEV